jgi:exopolyphosphatase/guanosine-5'-triphosphate,3'-diphosphate pyrophosphatase
LSFKDNTIQLTVLNDWAGEHPQSAYLLEEEIIAWKRTSWSFTVKTKSE